jgi:hypothetical protein
MKVDVARGRQAALAAGEGTARPLPIE